MTDLFKPEDFAYVEYIMIGTNVCKTADKEISDRANAILQERLLSKAVRIYGVCDPSKFVVTEWSTGLSLQDAINDEYTHQALLISIEEIKPKCEKHEPEIFNDQGRFGVYIPYSKPPKCVHCGVNLKAEWREVK